MAWGINVQPDKKIGKYSPELEHGSGGLSFSMQGSLLQKAAFSVSILKTPEAYGNTVARKPSAPPTILRWGWDCAKSKVGGSTIGITVTTSKSNISNHPASQRNQLLTFPRFTLFLGAFRSASTCLTSWLGRQGPLPQRWRYCPTEAWRRRPPHGPCKGKVARMMAGNSSKESFHGCWLLVVVGSW